MNALKGLMAFPLAACLVALVVFAGTGQAQAAGLPVNDFERSISKALERESWHRSGEAREYWVKVHKYGEALLAKNPKSTEYLLGTARAHYSLGDFKGSIDLYEALLAQNRQMGVDTVERFPWVYVYTGLAYAQIGNKAKVVEYWSQVPQGIGSVYTAIAKEVARLKNELAAEGK